MRAFYLMASSAQDSPDVGGFASRMAGACPPTRGFAVSDLGIPAVNAPCEAIPRSALPSPACPQDEAKFTWTHEYCGCTGLEAPPPDAPTPHPAILLHSSPQLLPGQFITRGICLPACQSQLPAIRWSLQREGGGCVILPLSFGSWAVTAPGCVRLCSARAGERTREHDAHGRGGERELASAHLVFTCRIRHHQT